MKKRVRNFFTCQWVQPHGRRQQVAWRHEMVHAWNVSGEEDYTALVKKWNLNKCDYYSPLGGIILRPKFAREDLKDTDFKVLVNSMNGYVMKDGTWRLEEMPGTPSAVYVKYSLASPKCWSQIVFNGKHFDFDAGVMIHVGRYLPNDMEVVNGKLQKVKPEAGALQPRVIIGLPEIVFHRPEKDQETGEETEVIDRAYRYSYVIPTLRPDQDDDDFCVTLLRQELSVAEELGIAEEWQVEDYWNITKTEKLAEYRGGDLYSAIRKLKQTTAVREVGVQIRFLEGVLYFGMGDVGIDFLWNHKANAKDPILEEFYRSGRILESSEESHSFLRIAAHAHQAFFLPCQQTLAATESEITLRTPPKIPEMCALFDGGGNVNIGAKITGVEGARREGAKLSLALDAPESINKFGVTLTAGNGKRTPILYGLRAYFKPIIEQHVPTPEALVIKKAHIVREESERGHVRAGHCTITVDPFRYSIPYFRGNEEVTVFAGSYTAIDGELQAPVYSYPVFHGRLLTPKYDYKPQPTQELEFELQGPTFTLKKKFCRDEIKSVAGESWLSAIRTALNAWGFPDELIFVEGNSIVDSEGNFPSPAAKAFDFQLDGGYEEEAEEEDLSVSAKSNNLAPEYDTDGLRWIDHLVSLNAGWTWREEPDLANGAIINITRRPDVNETPVAFVLRETPEYSGDKILSVTHDINLEDYANVIEVLGGGLASDTDLEEGAAEEDGTLAEKVAARFVDKESINDPSSNFFIGDAWYKIVDEVDNLSPQAAAKVEGLLAQQSRDIIIWETDGKALFPGQIVQFEVEGLGSIPLGTKARIISEDRVLEATNDLVTHRCTYVCKVTEYPLEPEEEE